MSRALPLKGLYTFVCVARSGSLRQAAEQLCLTPQAVSLQIRTLEQQLGFALFERHSSGIVLNTTGDQLLAWVERGLGLIERGVQEVRERQQRQQLRICASPWFAIHCLLPKLPEFEQQWPQLDVQISTSVPFPDFSSQRLDLAIQWGFGQWSFSHKKLLLTDDKLLVCAPSLLSEHKPLRVPSDLTRHRLLCTELSVELWRKLLNTLGVDLLLEHQALPLDSHAGLVEAVQKGLGVALVSVAEARELCAAGRLVAPLGEQSISSLNPSLMPGYWQVLREGEYSEPLIEFCQWMSGWLADHPRYPQQV
ncbi:MAG: LysR substrate-binding domain-containing protein [Marinobacterium sp.]|nr:LysR substrate-binding domain-containing protein [Marinobacterium sp.]